MESVVVTVSVALDDNVDMGDVVLFIVDGVVHPTSSDPSPQSSMPSQVTFLGTQDKLSQNA